MVVFLSLGFVPAEFATFAPMQRIFSSVGHNDDLARNLSAFALEMNEMAIILPHANERSLIVIDELARSKYFSTACH